MQYATSMIGSRVDDEESAALMRLIDAANVARYVTRERAAEGGRTTDAEDRLESLFGTSQRLAVYGSLAPGRQNHHIVRPLGGTWTEGVIEGDLASLGRGAATGFLALRLRTGGPAVPAHVLTSPALRDAWPDLDAFEGAEYRRMLVPVWSRADRGARLLLAVANVYEAAMPIDPPIDFPLGG
jgi:gamma-glutamylcyclotransferase (GGCT)/AIG2-like uncharacterized protein YtfP